MEQTITGGEMGDISSDIGVSAMYTGNGNAT